MLTLGRMRGTLPITLPLRFPVGAAHWAARVCRPYGNRGMFQRMPPPGASLASFWASRKKLAAGAAKRPFDIAFRFIRRQHKKPLAFPKEVSIL